MFYWHKREDILTFSLKQIIISSLEAGLGHILLIHSSSSNWDVLLFKFLVTLLHPLLYALTSYSLSLFNIPYPGLSILEVNIIHIELVTLLV